jgi:hypothetical protein
LITPLRRPTTLLADGATDILQQVLKQMLSPKGAARALTPRPRPATACTGRHADRVAPGRRLQPGRGATPCRRLAEPPVGCAPGAPDDASAE